MSTASGARPEGVEEGAPRSSVAPLDFVGVPSSPERLTLLRRSLSQWAAAAVLPPHDVEDLVIAVYEAMANVLDHAYDRPQRCAFDLHAAQTDDRVEVVVADFGHWRTPPADLGHRGRGLALIQRLAHHVDLRQDERGTTVAMCWYLPASQVRGRDST